MCTGCTANNKVTCHSLCVCENTFLFELLTHRYVIQLQNYLQDILALKSQIQHFTGRGWQTFYY
jgi:hypothetical protein